MRLQLTSLVSKGGANGRSTPRQLLDTLLDADRVDKVLLQRVQSPCTRQPSSFLRVRPQHQKTPENPSRSQENGYIYARGRYVLSWISLLSFPPLSPFPTTEASFMRSTTLEEILPTDSLEKVAFDKSRRETPSARQITSSTQASHPPLSRPADRNHLHDHHGPVNGEHVASHLNTRGLPVNSLHRASWPLQTSTFQIFQMGLLTSRPLPHASNMWNLLQKKPPTQNIRGL